LAAAISLGSIATIVLSLRTWKIPERANRRSLAIIEELKRKVAKLEEHYSYFKAREDVMERVVAIVAHDIRTPIGNLNAVIKYFLAGSFSQEEVTTYMREFEKEISPMLDLVNRLLHWVDCNTAEVVSIEAIDVAHEYATLLSMYERVARDKGITLVNTVTKKLTIGQDVSHLHVILRNLIDNAIKFTPGSGQIAVGCVEEASDSYRFFVSNTSAGMTDDKIEELLYTNNTVNTRKIDTRSAGLGIFLCKEHLQKLESFLTIENGPMGFLTFSFIIKSRIRSTLPFSQIGCSKGG